MSPGRLFSQKVWSRLFPPKAGNRSSCSNDSQMKAGKNIAVLQFSRQTPPAGCSSLRTAPSSIQVPVRRKSAFESIWKAAAILILLWGSFAIGIEMGRLLRTVMQLLGRRVGPEGDFAW